jgi:hypothetical protein
LPARDAYVADLASLPTAVRREVESLPSQTVLASSDESDPRFDFHRNFRARLDRRVEVDIDVLRLQRHDQRIPRLLFDVLPACAVTPPADHRLNATIADASTRGASNRSRSIGCTRASAVTPKWRSEFSVHRPRSATETKLPRPWTVVWQRQVPRGHLSNRLVPRP